MSVAPKRRDFLDALADRFDLACEKTCDSAAHEFRLAGNRICLKFASRQLQRELTAALPPAATRDAHEKPSLTVRLWDSTTTDVAAPAPPWGPEAFGARGEVNCPALHPMRACFDIEHGILLVFDPETKQGYAWFRDINRIPPWEIAAPLRSLFGWWASTIRGQLMHGAAVGLDDAAVLITARGGSGKSTTALACLAAGLDYCGDDYVLITPGKPNQVHHLYSTAKADKTTLVDRLPELVSSEHEFDPRNGKATLFLRDQYAEHLIESLPLSAIVIPKVVDRKETRFHREGTGAALRAMAPSTLFQLPGTGAEEFQTISGMVRETPVYRLELGDDMKQVVQEVKRLLRHEGDAVAGRNCSC